MLRRILVGTICGSLALSVPILLWAQQPQRPPQNFYQSRGSLSDRFSQLRDSIFGGRLGPEAQQAQPAYSDDQSAYQQRQQPTAPQSGYEGPAHFLHNNKTAGTMPKVTTRPTTGNGSSSQQPAPRMATAPQSGTYNNSAAGTATNQGSYNAANNPTYNRPAASTAEQSTYQADVGPRSSRRTQQPGYRPSYAPSSEETTSRTAPRNTSVPTANHSTSTISPQSGSTPAPGTDERLSIVPRSLYESPKSSTKPLPAPTPRLADRTSSAVPKPATLEPRSVPANEPKETVLPSIEEREPPVAAKTPTPDDDIAPVASATDNRLRSSKDNLLVAQRSPLISVETAGPRRIVVGSEAEYKVSVINNGDLPAQKVSLSIRIPEWAEIVDADPSQGDIKLPGEGDTTGLRWNLSAVGSKSREELVLKLVPRKSQPFDLAIQWTYVPESTQVMVEVHEAKLLLSLSGPGEVPFGEKVIYRLTFSNPGTADAQHVAVKLLPPGGEDDPGETHDVGTIPAGANKTVEMELVARQTGQLQLRAEATADGGLKASVHEQVLVRRAGLNVTVEGPKMQFARTVVTYKVCVTNPGNAVANNVNVSAQLPGKATFVSATGGGQLDADGRRVGWTVRSLAPGDEQSFLLRCQLEATGTNRLEALAACDDLKHAAQVNTEVEALADLVLDVIEPEGACPVGEEVTYEVHIKNRGTKAADSVDAVAYFSDGIEATTATGAKYDVAPGRVTFQSIAGILPGKEVVLKVKARASAPGNHVFRAEVTCQTLGSKLAEEGTTRFYSDDTFSSQDAAGAAAATVGSGVESSSRRGVVRYATPARLEAPDAGAATTGDSPATEGSN